MTHENKHTPAPWIWAENYQGLSNDKGEEILCFEPYENLFLNCENEDANAALIAAAPELLEALERCYEVFRMDDVDTAISLQCGMAIAKARGES